MSDIQDLTLKLKKFAADREWSKYHNNKDLALSLVLEAGEVLEHFQWKVTIEEIDDYSAKHKDEIAEEIADVAAYLFQLADNLGIDIKDALEKKIIKNGQKYPLEKSKGNAKKYTEL